MKTHSLCPVCYRHIEAMLFEQDDAVRIVKCCPVHGSMEAIVENDADYYRQIIAARGRFAEPQNIVVLDVTDKCNLTCSHCYHIPDNQSDNKSIQTIMEDVSMTPDSFNVILGGAEPTIRRDLEELVQEIGKGGRAIGVLSNGVRFSDREFAKCVTPFLNGIVLIGLNHRDYHGTQIHEKQLTGIRNLNDFGVKPMIGYTAEYRDLKDILEEALGLFAENMLAMVRLRFGANIGRHPELPTLSLSDHIKEVAKTCRELCLDYELLTNADNTIYHQMMLIAGMPVRVIQWPDEYNIVMGELIRGPWAKFCNAPISNFVHQIILRDGIAHKKLPVLDEVPELYTMRHFIREAESRANLGKVGMPHLNVITCGYDNARYIENLSGVKVANLHGRMSAAQRNELVKFWLENGAIQDEREARRRTEEVVHLGFDEAGRIVAVNTCFASTFATGHGSAPYWFYRQFVHPRYRGVRLSLALVRLTAAYFAEVFHQKNSGPKGIAMYLENPKLYNRSGRRALGWLGMNLASKDAQGAEVWTRDF